MSQPNFSRPGAIDLSALRGSDPRQAGAPAGTAPAGTAPAGTAPAGTATAGTAPGVSYLVDVTEASFQADVLERSLQVPVVVEFWSARAPGSEQLGELLRRLSSEYAGKFLLARIDIDANPGLAQAVGVQAVPLVVGVLRGQVVPLFQGTTDDAQARQYLDQLLTVAVANGITGRAEPVAAAADGPAAAAAETAAAQAVADARYAPAEQAMAAGDVEAAIAAYQGLLTQDPGDAIAKQGLAGASLVRRTGEAPADVRARAADAPDDVELQCRAADVDVLGGQVEDAFEQLLQVVRRTDGDDRDLVRKHLLELFEVVGADDPRVIKARRQLMAALF